MGVTVAISTWEGHREKLERAIISAALADETLVIDNGWSCRDIAEAYGATYIGRDPVNTAVSVSRNIAVKNASEEYLIHLDADDYLYCVPQPEGDWYYGDLLLAEAGQVKGAWDYSVFPRDRDGAREYAWVHLSLPTPMKAAFRTDWLLRNDLLWGDWSVPFSEDTLMCLKQHDTAPQIVYGEPFYVYCPNRDGGSSNDEWRSIFQDDLLRYLRETA